MDFDRMAETATAVITAFALKAVGALIAWIVGRYLIGLAVRMTTAALGHRQVDATLARYVGNLVNVLLNIVLIVALLGVEAV